MVARGDIVFQPTVTKPALDIAVEAYSRFAMRLLASITRFDRVMGHFDFPIWNAVRDLSDVDEESRAPGWNFQRFYNDAGNVCAAALRIFAKAAGWPMRAVGPATDSAPQTCPPLTTGTATHVKPAINSSASNAYPCSRIRANSA